MPTFGPCGGYENFPGSQSDVSIQPSIELISQELEVDLLAVFATVARMIMEQLNDAVPAVEDEPGESNLVTHMRNYALRLSNLEPVELEKSFIKPTSLSIPRHPISERVYTPGGTSDQLQLKICQRRS